MPSSDPRPLTRCPPAILYSPNSIHKDGSYLLLSSIVPGSSHIFFPRTGRFILTSVNVGRGLEHKTQTHTCMYTSGRAGLRQMDSQRGLEVFMSLMRGLFDCGFVGFVRFYLLRVSGQPAGDQYVAPCIGPLEHSSYCHLFRCGLSAPRWPGSNQALIWTCIEALLFFSSHNISLLFL